MLFTLKYFMVSRPVFYGHVGFEGDIDLYVFNNRCLKFTEFEI